MLIDVVSWPCNTRGAAERYFSGCLGRPVVATSHQAPTQCGSATSSCSALGKGWELKKARDGDIDADMFVSVYIFYIYMYL